MGKHMIVQHAKESNPYGQNHLGDAQQLEHPRTGTINGHQ